MGPCPTAFGGVGPWPAPDPATRLDAARPRRFNTPTGECCIRAVRVDGTIEGSGDCVACGTCLLIADRAWGSDP